MANGSGSGTGQGGKSMQDRELAARVRTLTLLECEKFLKKGKGRMYEAVLLKLAGGVLPRLNAGRTDDEPLIPNPLLDYVREKGEKSKMERSDEKNDSLE